MVNQLIYGLLALILIAGAGCAQRFKAPIAQEPSEQPLPPLVVKDRAFPKVEAAKGAGLFLAAASAVLGLSKGSYMLGLPPKQWVDEGWGKDPATWTAWFFNTPNYQAFQYIRSLDFETLRSLCRGNRSLTTEETAQVRVGMESGFSAEMSIGQNAVAAIQSTRELPYKTKMATQALLAEWRNQYTSNGEFAADYYASLEVRSYQDVDFWSLFDTSHEADSAFLRIHLYLKASEQSRLFDVQELVNALSKEDLIAYIVGNENITPISVALLRGGETHSYYNAIKGVMWKDNQLQYHFPGDSINEQWKQCRKEVQGESCAKLFTALEALPREERRQFLETHVLPNKQKHMGILKAYGLFKANGLTDVFNPKRYVVSVSFDILKNYVAGNHAALNSSVFRIGYELLTIDDKELYSLYEQANYIHEQAKIGRIEWPNGVDVDIVAQAFWADPQHALPELLHVLQLSNAVHREDFWNSLEENKTWHMAFLRTYAYLVATNALFLFDLEGYGASVPSLELKQYLKTGKTEEFDLSWFSNGSVLNQEASTLIYAVVVEYLGNEHQGWRTGSMEDMWNAFMGEQSAKNAANVFHAYETMSQQEKSNWLNTLQDQDPKARLFLMLEVMIQSSPDQIAKLFG